MSEDIKEQNPAQLVPVIQAVELIKVKTISKKIVDQLSYVHDEGGKFDWSDQEIVGQLAEGGILLRHARTGKLTKIGRLGYLEHVGKHLEETNKAYTYRTAREAANKAADALPQIFAV
jgi:hypothetical protein